LMVALLSIDAMTLSFRHGTRTDWEGACTDPVDLTLAR